MFWEVNVSSVMLTPSPSSIQWSKAMVLNAGPRASEMGIELSMWNILSTHFLVLNLLFLCADVSLKNVWHLKCASRGTNLRNTGLQFITLTLHIQGGLRDERSSLLKTHFTFIYCLLLSSQGTRCLSEASCDITYIRLTLTFWSCICLLV